MWAVSNMGNRSRLERPRITSLSLRVAEKPRYVKNCLPRRVHGTTFSVVNWQEPAALWRNSVGFWGEVAWRKRVSSTPD